MKIIKSKILIVFLVSVMSFALTSCGGGDSKNDLVKEVNGALKNSAGVTESDVTLEGKVKSDTLKQQGGEIKLKADIKIKNASQDKVDLEKMEAAIDMEVGAKAGSFNAKMYIKDGYTYTEVMGIKSKSKLETPGLENLNITSSVNKIDEAHVKEAKKEDGKIILAIDAEKFFKSLMENIEKKNGAKADSEKMNDAVKAIHKAFKSLTLEFTIKDKKIKQMDLKAKITDKKSGLGKATLSFSFKYNKIGNIGEIAFPKDLKDYKSINNTGEKSPSPLGI